MKGLWTNLSLYLTAVLVVVGAMAPSGSAEAGSHESFIRCTVEGGNLPVRVTTMDFYRQGKETYLAVREEFWDTRKKGTAKTVKIAAGDYERLWGWVEAEDVWDLGDVIFAAVDAPTYTFHLKKGEREKTIRALSVSTIENQKYYRFYSLLRKTRDQYVAR